MNRKSRYSPELTGAGSHYPHTASRFMSHEEYNFFEEKVESRVKSIIDSDRHEDTAQR